MQNQLLFSSFLKLSIKDLQEALVFCYLVLNSVNNKIKAICHLNHNYKKVTNIHSASQQHLASEKLNDSLNCTLHFAITFGYTKLVNKYQGIYFFISKYYLKVCIQIFLIQYIFRCE